MRAQSSSSIRDAVAECVSSKREILAAYVFGSVATGRTREGSDIDVAVLLQDGMGSSRMFQYRLRLMADLGSALHRSDVEVVILNEAPPLLAHRVLSKGKLLFERSASARVRFQIMTAYRYLDILPASKHFIRHLTISTQATRMHPLSFSP